MSKISLLLLLSCSAFCAYADLYSANSAYVGKDFPTAFKEYRELAELGQPQAQFALAVMYANGEGTDVSLTNAHAWASLASRSGDDPRAKALVAELEPQLTPTSLRFSSEIQERFGSASLNARLMPNFLTGREYIDRDPARRVKADVPPYPMGAAARGVQGQVYVEFLIASDGRARLPRIVYAVPPLTFDNYVRSSVMHSEYLPARINGKPIASTVGQFYHFKLAIATSQYVGLESLVKSTLVKAQAGDPSAQLLYAMMLAGLPQLNQTYDKALPWFLKAAQSGSSYAQYQIGAGLIQGRGCECDAAKGDIWLEKAAQNDQPDAQVTLAEHLLRDAPTEQSVAGALVWLERAAKHGNGNAKLYLAAVLATNQQAKAHDHGRALALTEDITKEFKDDPTLWEIRAAAEAAGGDFPAAGKDQALAIKQAESLGWDLTPMRERQDSYAAKRPWSGDLLAY